MGEVSVSGGRGGHPDSRGDVGAVPMEKSAPFSRFHHGRQLGSVPFSRCASELQKGGRRHKVGTPLKAGGPGASSLGVSLVSLALPRSLALVMWVEV